jgi:protein-tyrosine phosphatase
MSSEREDVSTSRKDELEDDTSPVLDFEEGNVPWVEEAAHESGCEYCSSLSSKSRFDDMDIWNPIADLGENVLLGGRYPALCPYYLQKLGVVSVLRVMDDDEAYPRPPKFTGFKYLTLDIKDSYLPAEGEKLVSMYPLAFEFLSAGRRNGKVYVHCWKGQSRSATVCIAYLMKDRGLSLEQARNILRKDRLGIRPNIGFEEQLRKFERMLDEQRNRNREGSGTTTKQGSLVNSVPNRSFSKKLSLLLPTCIRSQKVAR